MTPDECVKRYGDHKWVVKPGGSRQKNPYTNKPTTMKRKDCSRCGTTEMWFEDDPDDDSSDSGGGGGFRCPDCGKTGSHEEWCRWA